MFNNIYKDKKILITGHTGFKGTWLTIWLLRLGATIVGISKDVPTNPSMFKELELELKIKSLQEDIRDLPKMIEIISDEKPDFLFHLAAQPVVSKSYSDPIETLSSNVMGVANILESLKKTNYEFKLFKKGGVVSGFIEKDGTSSLSDIYVMENVSIAIPVNSNNGTYSIILEDNSNNILSNFINFLISFGF